MSNTKLTDYQKNHRKQLLAKYPKVEFGYFGNTTVLINPAGQVNHMAVSIASDDEAKVRRKVGEYNCLVRLDCEMVVIMPTHIYAQDFAYYIDS